MLYRLGNSFSFAAIFISVSVSVVAVCVVVVSLLLLLLFRLTFAIRKSQRFFALLVLVQFFDFQFFIFQQKRPERVTGKALKERIQVCDGGSMEGGGREREACEIVICTNSFRVSQPIQFNVRL